MYDDSIGAKIYRLGWPIKGESDIWESGVHVNSLIIYYVFGTIQRGHSFPYRVRTVARLVNKFYEALACQLPLRVSKKTVLPVHSLTVV